MCKILTNFNYIWFSFIFFIDHLFDKVREIKYEGKLERNKKWNKIKNRLKPNKIFSNVSLKLFPLFPSQ